MMAATTMHRVYVVLVHLSYDDGAVNVSSLNKLSQINVNIQTNFSVTLLVASRLCSCSGLLLIVVECESSLLLLLSCSPHCKPTIITNIMTQIDCFLMTIIV